MGTFGRAGTPLPAGGTARKGLHALPLTVRLRKMAAVSRCARPLVFHNPNLNPNLGVTDFDRLCPAFAKALRRGEPAFKETKVPREFRFITLAFSYPLPPYHPPVKN
jgi:hypothetical protein